MAGSAVSMLRYARVQAEAEASADMDLRHPEGISFPASSEEPVPSPVGSSHEAWPKKLQVPAPAGSSQEAWAAWLDATKLPEDKDFSTMAASAPEKAAPQATSLYDSMTMAAVGVEEKMNAAMRAHAVERDWLRQMGAGNPPPESSNAQSGSSDAASGKRPSVSSNAQSGSPDAALTIKDLQAVLQTADKRESQLQAALQDAVAQISSLKSMNSDLLNAAKSRELELKKGAENTIAEVNAVNEATTKLHDLRVAELLDVQAQLRIQLEQSKKESEEEKEKQQKAANEVTAANVRINSLETEVCQLNEKLQEPMASHQTQERVSEQDAGDLKARHEMRVSELLDIQAQLRTQIEQSEKESQQEREKYQKADARIASLETEVRQLKKKAHGQVLEQVLEQASEELIEEREKHQATMAEAIAAKACVANLEMQVSHLSGQLQALSSFQAQLQNEDQDGLDEKLKDEKLLMAISEATAAKARVASLEIEVNLLNGKLQEPWEYLQEQEKHQGTLAEDTDAKGRVTSLEAEISQLTAKIQSQEELHAQGIKELSAKLQELSDSQVQVEDQGQRELKEDRERHQATLGDATSAQARVAGLETEVSQLTTKLQESLDVQAEEKESHQAAATEATAALSQLTTKLQESLGALAEEKERHQTTEAEATAAKARVASLEGEVHQLSTNLQETKQEVYRLEATLQESLDSKAELQEQGAGELKKEQEKYKVALAEATAAKTRVTSLEAEVSQLGTKLQESLKSQEKLREDSAKELKEIEDKHQAALAEAAAAKTRQVDSDNALRAEKEQHLTVIAEATTSKARLTSLEFEMRECREKRKELQEQLDTTEDSNRKLRDESMAIEKEHRVATCWGNLLENMWTRRWRRDAGAVIRLRFFTLNRVSDITTAVSNSARGVCDIALSNIDTLLDEPGISSNFADKTDSSDGIPAVVDEVANHDGSGNISGNTPKCGIEEDPMSASQHESFKEVRYPELEDALNKALAAVAAADASAKLRMHPDETETKLPDN